LAQRSRCWYFRNPHMSCLKKGGADCPARLGNHLYGVAFDLGPCVAPHPSTLGAALAAYDASVAINKRGAIAIADLFGDGSNGAADNTLSDGEWIVSVEMGAPVPGERTYYGRAISRTHAEWPLVEVVVRAVIERGRFQFVRVTAGGIAPIPLRFRHVEDALRSGNADHETIRNAAALAVKGANPLPRTSYKLQLLEQKMIDALEEVAG